VQGVSQPCDGVCSPPDPSVPVHPLPQVAALFDRVQAEQGRLDLLVNAVWGGNELPSLQADWGQPCWEVQQAPAWEAMLTAGVRSAVMGGWAVQLRVGGLGIPSRSAELRVPRVP